MASQWSQNYETLKRQIQNRKMLGQIFTAQECQEISYSYAQLDQQLNHMAQAPMEHNLYASEIARRRVILDNLKKQLPTPQQLPSIGKTAGSSSSSSKAGLSEQTFVPTSDKGLAQRQAEMMRLQDNMLLDISDGVDRLHQQALTIGDEAKIHVRLLDDLDSNVGSATSALQAESVHAERIKEQSRMCYLYICIGVEVLLIILLLVIAFH